MTSQDTPPSPDPDAEGPDVESPDVESPDVEDSDVESPHVEAPAPTARSRAADATAKATDDLKDRSKRLLDSLSAHSLSARSRGEGWEKPTGELAKYRSEWRAAMRVVLQRVLFRGFVNSVVTPEVRTHRRVKSIRGPFVLVANHTSHVDGPLLAMSLPWAQGRFLSTGAASDYWFDHWYRRIFVRTMLNAFPIDRGSSRKHSGTSRRLLRSGVPILVFPEGTRQTTGTMAEFKAGAAALAIRVGVPVVPAAIIGGYEAMPKGRNWPMPGRPPVRVVFGEPMISHRDESAVEFTTRIQAQVKDLYDEHHDEVLGEAAPGEEESA